MPYFSQLIGPPSRDDLVEAIIGHTRGSDVVRKGAPAEVLSRMSMADLCREICHWQSADDVSTMPSNAVIRAAFSGGALEGAFDGIFASTFAGAYVGAESKSAGWCHEEKELENYQRTRIVRLLDTASLLPRGREPAEVQSLTGYAVEWVAMDFAKSLIVNEIDLINDQTRAILQAAATLGRGAVRLRDDSVFSLLLANPSLSDDLPLFHADHGNLLSGPTSALSNTSLAEAISAIRSQVVATPDGVVHLELTPRYLIVSPSLENVARQTLRLQKLDNDRIDLALIVTSRLSSIGIADPLSGVLRAGTDTNWLLVCDDRTCPPIALGYLKGQDEPEIRSYDLAGSGDYAGAWGRGWDIHQALAVAALDHRGACWSDGQ